MWYTYDCEFLEDGKTIKFISIGMVAEDGREYYAVNAEMDTRAVAADNWLMDNVMSSIGHETFVEFDVEGGPVTRNLRLTDPAAKPRDQIAQDIIGFVGNDPEPELWAWYCAYDHVCLAQLFGKMIDIPDNIPMFTNDIKTLVKEVERRQGFVGMRLPPQPTGHHNALDDARHNVVRYNYLQALL